MIKKKFYLIYGFVLFLSIFAFNSKVLGLNYECTYEYIQGDTMTLKVFFNEKGLVSASASWDNKQVWGLVEPRIAKGAYQKGEYVKNGYYVCPSTIYFKPWDEEENGSYINDNGENVSVIKVSYKAFKKENKEAKATEKTKKVKHKKEATPSPTSTPESTVSDIQYPVVCDYNIGEGNNKVNYVITYHTSSHATAEAQGLAVTSVNASDINVEYIHKSEEFQKGVCGDKLYYGVSEDMKIFLSYNSNDVSGLSSNHTFEPGRGEDNFQVQDEWLDPVESATPKDRCEIISTEGELYQILKEIIGYLQIGTIFVVLVLGILDLGGAVASSDDGAFLKAGKRFGQRLIALALVFLVPLLINFIINLVNLGACGNQDGKTDYTNNLFD